MPEIPEGILTRLAKLNSELDSRARRYRLLDRYVTGDCPPPRAVTDARVTQAYRRLIPVADAPWAGTVVDSVQDRLELAGIRTGQDEMDVRLQDVWQRNFMDSEWKLAQNSALTSGRSYAIVWPGEKCAEISLETSEQCIVEYRPGSRHQRVAALKRWMEDGRPYATLYLPDAIYKFIGPQDSSGYGGTQWEPRIDLEDPDEGEWPLVNKFKVVPVIEVGVNRKLKPGIYGHARGEFEHVLGLLDRINLLTFLGLVVAFYQGFPLRGLIGDRILRDDNQEPIAPFKALANEVFQLENPNAKIAEFKAADRDNLRVFDELSQLAMLTKTPRHYLPYSGGLSNVSADTIRADEGGLTAKVVGHKSSLGDSVLEISRLCGMMHPEPFEVPPAATVEWKDHESRSLAERADAFTKLAPFLPWQVVVQRVLNASQDEVRRWEKMRNDDVLAALLLAAKQRELAPTDDPKVVPDDPKPKREGIGDDVPSGA